MQIILDIDSKQGHLHWDEAKYWEKILWIMYEKEYRGTFFTIVHISGMLNEQTV